MIFIPNYDFYLSSIETWIENVSANPISLVLIHCLPLVFLAPDPFSQPSRECLPLWCQHVVRVCGRLVSVHSAPE